MHAAALGSLLSLLLAACAGSTPAEAPVQPFDSALFKHWIHSFEEDTASARVYRPKGYAFPRARGVPGARQSHQAHPNIASPPSGEKYFSEKNPNASVPKRLPARSHE